MKYKLIASDMPKLFRIKALKDFSDVKAGDIGGYVSGYHNLSQAGDCWVYHNAKVHHNAKVSDNAKMYHEAEMFNNAEIQDNSKMFENAGMYEYSRMCHNAAMRGKSKMYSMSTMYHYSQMNDNSTMYDDSTMLDRAQMLDNSKLRDRSSLSGVATLSHFGVLKGRQKLKAGTLTVACDDFRYTQDSRSYIFLAAYKNNEIIQITAGCRRWNNYKLAKQHFTVNYCSNANVPEVLFILKVLKRMRKLV